jgi:hypothetical protein
MKMQLSYRVLVIACAGIFVLAGAAVANMLVNPGFEDGLNGWFVFGNTYAETSNPPQFDPYEGNGLVSMFGNWSGPWNVSGMFQEFDTCEGDEWQLSSKSRHWSGDPMVGVGAPNDNWVVQKLAWMDAGGAEIGGVESTILDGTFATNTWFNNAAIVGIAPAGAVKVQALILYIQPADAGGAAHIDNCELLYLSGPSANEGSTWGKIKSLYR